MTPTPSGLVSISAVAGPPGGVAQDPIGVGHADHGQPVLRLRVGDAVAAEYRALIRHGGFGPGAHDPRERGGLGVVGEGGDRQTEQGRSTHGVQVAEGVGGGDGAEGVGVVDDRREEVDRRDDGEVVAHTVDARIVGAVEPDQRIGVADQRHLRERFDQRGAPELAAAAATPSHVGQPRHAPVIPFGSRLRRT